MGTSGLKLIQDLLAKSVAKWSGEAVKTTEDESNKSIKAEEKNNTAEYVETDSDVQNIKTEQEKIKCENPKNKVKEGSKSKLVEIKKDTNSKEIRKTCITPGGRYNDTDFLKEIDDIHESDLKDDKSLIMKLNESSAAIYTSDGNDNAKVIKTHKFKNIQSEKPNLCKKEVDIKTDTIDNLKMKNEDLVSTDVKTNLSHPVLRNHDDKRGVTGLKRKKHGMSTLAQKTNYKRKVFSPEEDEILQHAINTDNINNSSLAKQLGRSTTSVHKRIKRLKVGDRKISRREYTLMEDMLIMDRVLEKLPGKKLKDLEMLADDTSSEFSASLGRTTFSIIATRWALKLKPWILQYYAGTLNLDIKRQLANFIADTFTGFDSIDWSLVGDRSEFAGHTLPSLKQLFYGTLFKNTKNHQNLEPSEVTLRNIVDEANMDYGLMKKLTPTFLMRQKEVIDYFEQYVKKHGIVNFL